MPAPTRRRRDSVGSAAPAAAGPAGQSSSAGGRQALLAAAQAELAEHGSAGISLRAVARRAGMSHAAPKHHFGDRAGLLSAVAADGFAALSTELHRVGDVAPERRLAALGRAYIDFGVTHPALFDLMFRPSELRADDPALRQAQRAALDTLSTAVADSSSAVAAETTPGGTPVLTVLSWALAHGLVVLARDGALAVAAGADDPAAAARLAHRLTEQFSSFLDRDRDHDHDRPAERLPRAPRVPAPGRVGGRLRDADKR